MVRLAVIFTPLTSVYTSMPLSSNQKKIPPKNSGNKKKYTDGNVLCDREYKTVAGNKPQRAPADIKAVSTAHQ